LKNKLFNKNIRAFCKMIIWAKIKESNWINLNKRIITDILNKILIKLKINNKMNKINFVLRILNSIIIQVEILVFIILLPSLKIIKAVNI